MASIGNHDDSKNNDDEQQQPLLPRPAPERVHRQPIPRQPTLRAMVPDHPPRVVRPHRQPTRPLAIDEIDTLRLPPDAQPQQQHETPIDQMPTDRLTPEPGSQPAMVRHQPPTLPDLERGERNEYHTEYQLDRRPWTRVSGYYELVADISRFGDITLYSVSVGKQWRSIPLIVTHEAAKALLPALLDASRYYGFPVDDDDDSEGA